MLREDVALRDRCRRGFGTAGMIEFVGESDGLSRETKRAARHLLDLEGRFG